MSDALAPRPTQGREKVAAIAAAFVGLAAGYPSAYGATTTTFILPLTEAFGWGRIVPSLMYTAAMLGMAIASLVLGRAIERFGEARLALVGSLGLGLVFLGLSVMPGAPWIAMALSFLAGAFGAGTGVGLYLSMLPKWFERDLGKALGFSIVGQSLGVTLMPWISSTAMGQADWRHAYRALGATEVLVTLLAVLLLAWLGRRWTARSGPLRVALAEQTNLPSLSDRRFQTLAIIMFLVTTGVFAAAIHLFPLYADRGVARSMMPQVALALGLGTLAGRLLSGVLLDHVDARVVGAGTFGLGAIALLWLALPTEGHLGVLLPPVLLGAALGAESDILAYVTRRYFGLVHFPAIYNRLLVAYYLGAVTGPLSIGWAFDAFHETRRPLLIMGALCALATWATTRLPRPDIAAAA